ncbi:tellurite resistance protein TerC [Granulicella pectinivorans]|uniref:Tellurite resistance protein TerC n=1 Tax=Granulicella pectinivorans TaxID=474950 RepID=A0A1I6MP29_9BACT|nr:TerC/Alx family metal homeostasis membrane protein [Granulicella pectinivorans]SFS17462.1 tellurite resistance protein TerC [Granulicella pectinivorans]
MPATTPISHWIGFHLCLVVLLGVELVYYRTHKHSPIHKKSLVATALWIGAALAFALFVYATLGGQSTSEYLASYALEEALSIDNLFVFLLLFGVFKIDSSHQPRVLFWGVSGAIVMRGAFIAGGIGLLERFHWVSYAFGLILLYAAIRLLFPSHETSDSKPPVWIQWISRIHPVSLRTDRFFAREDGHRRMTMLFLALIAIEATDLVFALDSIPAVLSITRHPFLAYTSNIMAVMGLRSLYFLLIGMLAKLRFLHYGLAAVLAFAAIKMLATRWFELGPLSSLAVILGLLGITTGLSLAFPAKPAQPATP